MFKKNDSPISLFSFQDIVTSLIGIMLLILLIMCIQLLTKVETQEIEDSKQDDLEQLEQEKQEAQNRKNIVLKQVLAANYSARSNIRITPYELNRKIKDLTAQLAKAEQEKKYKQEEQENLEKQYQTVETQKQTQEKDSVVKQQKEKVRQLKTEVRDLKKTRDLLKQRIAASPKLEITYDDNTDLIPLVITVSGKKITVKKLAEKKILWELSKPSIKKSHLSSLMTKLSDFSNRKYHFVFLVKPSAAMIYSSLESRFKEKFPNEQYGIEPIYEEEEVE